MLLNVLPMRHRGKECVLLLYYVLLLLERVPLQENARVEENCIYGMLANVTERRAYPPPHTTCMNPPPRIASMVCLLMCCNCVAHVLLKCVAIVLLMCC